MTTGQNGEKREDDIRRPLRGEDVVEEIRRVRATLWEEAGGDLKTLLELAERRAREIRSSDRKSA